MADITAADVTITIEAGSPHNPRIEGSKRKSLVKLVFGDGAKTYPAGGVPLPAFDKFGLVRNLDTLQLIDSDDASGIVWKYDHANKKLRGYILGVNVGAAGAGVLDDFPLDTAAEPLAEAASLGAVGLEAGVNLLGRLQELKAASTPAAQTLYGEAIGW